MIQNKKRGSEKKDHKNRPWGLGENEFISNMTSFAALKIEQRASAMGLMAFWMIFGSIFFMTTYLVVISSVHPIRMIVASSVMAISGIIAIIYIRSKVKKNEKKELEKLDPKDPGKLNCVVSLLDDHMLVEFDAVYSVYENEVYYDEIGSFELNGAQYLKKKGIKISMPDAGSKVKMAPHPGHILGGIYPLRTPSDQLVAIRLKNRIPMNCFRSPTGLIASRSPDKKVSSDQLIISIRNEDKTRFNDSLMYHMEHQPVNIEGSREEEYWY